MRISVVVDCSDPKQLVPFWEAALDYQLANTLDGYHVLAPRNDEAGPALVLQPVPEPRKTKNRVHVDLHPADAETHIERLRTLGGASLGERVEQFGIWWQPM
ncbi:MAG: VOC family protein, partial [Candidatus Nanopelagicales bacterium]